MRWSRYAVGSMSLPEYASGLRSAYFGEVVAERVYRELSRRAPETHQQTKLGLVADVERLTARALTPAVRRLGLKIEQSDIDTRVSERLTELGSLGWRDFVAQASVKWPPYIGQFLQLAALAPKEDTDAMRVLVAHERALVHFIELEKSDSTSMRSAEPLTALLALLGGNATSQARGNG
jgi:hypothetical protein